MSENDNPQALMKITRDGKEHFVGNTQCPACAEGFPRKCENPYKKCDGLVHAEPFANNVQSLQCDMCTDTDFIIQIPLKKSTESALRKAKVRPTVQKPDPGIRNEIDQFTRRFRRAVLAIQTKELPPSLYKSSIVSFPRSGVADVTLLLGEYLHRTGYGMAEYVTGWREKRCHCWLELAGIIIDVAADSFPDAPSRVMITANRAWHKQFKEDIRHSADIRAYDQHTREQLLVVYEVVAKHLKAT